MFVKKYYPPKKVKYWEDIKCNRDGTPQRLWMYRARLKMSTDEFARSIGLTKKEYEKYERIGAQVPDSLIERICEKYKIDRAVLKIG